MKLVWTRPPSVTEWNWSNLLTEPKAPTIESIKAAIRHIHAVERRQRMHVVKPPARRP